MSSLVEVEGEIIKWWVSASNHVDRGQTPPKSSQTCVHAIIDR